ncbi:SPOR domain-containing protein [Noviherbaspirillum denitrificans]|uniref:Cell division protein n=1 Tax=Noviherbaspirillum denitrificans TaxID=1968433 RepID=A0A254TGV8_9BURK|nr:SPOR domain-containing protein [Noviherbaspirillum denitrificans]OWW21870.1 cell division protein [Noviherbaspirillum denitrificans]
MQKYRQQGGTILGLIIGLIIGLGIALGVAMTINKTPMPFTDKSGKVKAGDPTPSQAADPNRPLYGNKAAKEAKEAVREQAPPENTAAPQPDKKPEIVKVDPKTEAKAEGKLPVIDLTSTAKKPETEAKAESADDKWSYFLQAGAFREPADAEGMRAKLALMGVEAKVSERQAETGVLYRVRVGPFNQMEAMNKVRGKLSDNGVDAAVVRTAK